MTTNTASASKAKASAAADATGFAPTWFVPAPEPPVPSAFNFETTTESSARLWRYFMAARLLVALGLLAWLAWAQAQGQAPLWLLLLCAAYLVSTAAVLRWL